MQSDFNLRSLIYLRPDKPGHSKSAIAKSLSASGLSDLSLRHAAIASSALSQASSAWRRVKDVEKS